MEVNVLHCIEVFTLNIVAEMVLTIPMSSVHRGCSWTATLLFFLIYRLLNTYMSNKIMLNSETMYFLVTGPRRF